MKPETAAALDRLRAQATPGTDLILFRGPLGTISFLPHEIVGKPDDELLAFIAKRLAEH